jgi:hypothetical protein
MKKINSRTCRAPPPHEPPIDEDKGIATLARVRAMEKENEWIKLTAQ